MAAWNCRLNIFMPTTREPMAGFVRGMREAERQDGVLSVSLVHGFPHGDVPDCGARTLVITDNDPDAAARLAEQLGPRAVGVTQRSDGSLHDHRCGAWMRPWPKADGPIVIGDVSDNAGGGAPSDATFFLRRLLERGVRGAVVATIWDPIAVRFCMEAGEGSKIRLRVGGKCGPESGDPLDLPVTVERIVKEARQTLFGFQVTMGEAVWVSCRVCGRDPEHQTPSDGPSRHDRTIRDRPGVPPHSRHQVGAALSWRLRAHRPKAALRRRARGRESGHPDTAVHPLQGFVLAPRCRPVLTDHGALTFPPKPVVFSE